MRITHVFGRPIKADDPLVEALQEWMDSGDLARKAIACNIMSDHRVSQEREGLLRCFFQDSPMSTAAGRLEDALLSYKEQYIRTPRVPHFVDHSANGANCVDYNGASPDRDLVRILDLNGMDGVFRAAERRGVPSFLAFSSEIRVLGALCSTKDHALLKWLNSSLEGKSTEDVKNFVKDLIVAMYPAEEDLKDPMYRGYFHPAWVTRWRDFKGFLSRGPERWGGIIGVPNARGLPRWLLALRYQLPENVPLVRPTVLDAGYFPYHFPSPPQASLTDGGHPMDLQSSRATRRLLSEFIHRQIQHPRLPLRFRDFWIARTVSTKPQGGDLWRRRRAHHRRLCRQYELGVEIWMPKWMI